MATKRPRDSSPEDAKRERKILEPDLKAANQADAPYLLLAEVERALEREGVMTRDQGEQLTGIGFSHPEHLTIVEREKEKQERGRRRRHVSNTFWLTVILLSLVTLIVANLPKRTRESEDEIDIMESSRDGGQSGSNSAPARAEPYRRGWQSDASDEDRP